MPIRLIALDLDDTLLREDLSISPANREALRAAHRAGAKIVLASGRNIYSMRAYAAQLGLEGPDDYLIASNGAEIVETASGRRLYERRIEPELCREIARHLDEEGFPWQVYENGTILANARNPWTEEDTRLTGQPNFIVEKPDELLARGQIKFVVPGDPELLPALREKTARRFSGRAEVLISKPYFMEVLAAGVDKGEALARLARLLGLGLDATMACGDAMNDLGMLRAAGISCAPANAIPAAKATASFVSTRTNDEDFVAEVVQRFVLAG